MGNVSTPGERGIGAIDKWTLPFDSAQKIGLSTPSNGKLMVVGECVMEGFENGKHFCL